MKKFIVSSFILFLAAGCSSQSSTVVNYPPPSSPPVTTTSTPPSTASSSPVTYNNTQYGFTFSLPQDWQGYTIVDQQWTGTPLEGSSFKNQISGPEIIIRNPLWTATQHYEDIPVMVFTPTEWNEIEQEKLGVSAAPIPPSELGQNANYVFALPPRYDYDYSTGYQEVEQIMQSNPLKGY